MSIRSPANSSTMFLMRLPRTPTHAPTQSTRWSRAAHGHLGAVARLAGDRPDLDHAVGDFGNFLLEQAGDQVVPGAAEDDLHAAADLADVADHRPDALVGVMRFAGDLFAAGQDGLDVAQRDGGGSTLVALDDAGDQLVHQFRVLVEQGVAFRLADLLDHDLLGGLGADPLGDVLGRQDRAVVHAR